MLVSAAACFAFGASSAGTFFIVVVADQRLANRPGWPGNVKAMAEWTPAQPARPR